jgi:ribosomal protein L6P/L9E
LGTYSSYASEYGNRSIWWVCTKALEIIGVGYKFDVKGPRKIELALGFSHKVNVDAPEGITIEADKDEKNKIHIKSHDKQLLGYFAAYIRLSRSQNHTKEKVSVILENMFEERLVRPLENNQSQTL